jgi:protein-tyrosine-phosphatase/DNA-binding transcriptional ArsR family regulator
LLGHEVRWRLVSMLAHGDYQVHELVRMLDKPTNLVSYHLTKLRRATIVTERRSSADARDVYYSLDLERLQTMFHAVGQELHPAIGVGGNAAAAPAPAPERPIRLLFLCSHNSARSQMAEAITRHLGGKRVEVVSAGLEPTTIHPDAIRAMAHCGIEMRGQRSKHLQEYADEVFDYIITVCDRVRETCPVFPGDPDVRHWSFADPAGVDDDVKRRDAFIQTATQLTTRVRFLLTLMAREHHG